MFTSRSITSSYPRLSKAISEYENSLKIRWIRSAWNFPFFKYSNSQKYVRLKAKAISWEFVFLVLCEHFFILSFDQCNSKITVYCGVRGRVLASYTECRGFQPQCGGRLSSLTCWQLQGSINMSWKRVVARSPQ